MRHTCLVLFTLALLLGSHAFAQPKPGLLPVAEGLGNTLFVTSPPGDTQRLFVVVQSGQIRVIANNSLLDTPFLDIADAVESGGERGLLGLAFHPDYAANGRFFVYYTARPGDTLVSRISEFTVPADPNVADPASERVLLSFEQPFNNHNAGMLAFGPDGYLYIASGDGGSGNDPSNYAQNLESLLGKLLRIDVDNAPQGEAYAIPPDNPFVENDDARPEVWAYGLRNPWRFSFDRETGDLWIADVGQSAIEEVNVQPADAPGGDNYGWRVFEGTRCNTTVESQAACDALEPHATFPIFEYEHDMGRSITGGYVYRGAALPALQGAYVFGDFVFARVWSLRYDGAEVSGFTDWTPVLDPGGNRLSQVASFGEDAAGELYVVSLAGRVFRLAPAHRADQNGDFTIGLDELLRVVQFFNAGGLHCAEGTEDGYAPGGEGPRDCPTHSSDYAPQDWRISLPELLRLIQFYNIGAYHPCEIGEDGFCPGTS